MEDENDWVDVDPPEDDTPPSVVKDWDGWYDLVTDDNYLQELQEAAVLVDPTPFTEPVWGKVVNKN
jgi:hypothetical protein